MEVLHEGWLTKSPPQKKNKWTIIKAKWRRRYFVLHEPCAADSFPGVHAALDYYKSASRKDRLGSIDLTQCDEVLSSLDSSGYRHLFALRSKHKGHDRVYYLAASSESDMTSWVDCLCQVLGLKELDDKPEATVSVSSSASSPQPAPRTLTPSPASQHLLTTSHNTSISSPTDSPSQPRRNSDAYIPLDSCFSDKTEQPRSPLNQVPPPPFVARRPSIPDDVPPLPPPCKTGESRLVPAPEQSTYDSPTFSYVNLDDDNEYKIPPPLAHRDSNDNVYKSPRVDNDSLYKVPPVNHLQFMDDIYKVPPRSSAPRKSEGDLYDVPPTRLSPPSTTSHSESLYDRPPPIDHSDLYDVPPPEPCRINSRKHHNIYDHPPPAGESRQLTHYDPPTPRSQVNHSLNDVVPVPCRRRASDQGIIVTDSRYVNLPPKTDSHIPSMLHKALPPPIHDDLYDFPKSTLVNELDAMPPAPPQACTGANSGNMKKHKYANAPTGIVVADTDSMYVPMGSSPDMYLPMGPDTPGQRVSTDSAYTIMTSEIMMQPQQQQVCPDFGPHITSRTRSFKRTVVDSSPSTEVRLPTRKNTYDAESSSDDDDDDSEFGSHEALQSRKPPTSLQSKPPPPRRHGEIEYIDLDLDKDRAAEGGSISSSVGVGEVPVFPRSPGPPVPRHANASPTDYKEIDFVKTQALNEMRKDLENKRKSSEKSMDE